MRRFSQYFLVFFFVFLSFPVVAEDFDACLPYAMPSKDVILNSPKKVFAHYFSRFPLSIDNKYWVNDYYTQGYLNANGEKNKWLAQGGYLRSRPLPVQPSTSSTYQIQNLKTEIKLAVARGIGGFTYDILSMKDIEPNGYLQNMLQAVSESEPRFKIVLMPDMSALGKDTENVITIIKELYDRPELYRLSDGRLVVAPFLSESVSPAAWGLMKAKLEKEGFKIAFMPTFLSLSRERIDQYNSVSEGFGTFGTPLAGQGKALASNSSESHAVGKPFMAGISPQGYRPKDYIYWESEGSLAYRKSWEGAIEGGADFIQLTTWNDFSESTQVMPYMDLAGSSGTGYFDLTGYYASWFAAGSRPAITQDALYYFYRKQSVNAAATKAGKQTVNSPSHIQGKDLIELVGFLTAPATLSISIGGKTSTKDVERGVQSFVVPLEFGTPRFSLIREGKTEISFEGSTQIYNSFGLPNGYADLTYWSGSSAITESCRLDLLEAKRDH